MLAAQVGDGSDSEEWGGGRNKKRKNSKKGGAAKADNKKGGKQGHTVTKSKKAQRWEKAQEEQR